MPYPGCSVHVKRYLWNTMCLPVLMYGTECIHLSRKNKQLLETTQGNLIKQALGFSKRSHSTNLLAAFGVRSIGDLITMNSALLLYRISLVCSPARDLCFELLARFISHGERVKGTLIDRLIESDISPSFCIYNKFSHEVEDAGGVADSLMQLIRHQNFLKPYSEEHVMAVLLTKSF